MNQVDHKNITDTDIENDNIVRTVQARRLKLLLDPDLETDKLEISLMNSITTTALTSKRISVDDSNLAADREVSKALVDAIDNLAGNPFHSTAIEGVLVRPALPDVEIILDETSRVMAELSCPPELAD